MKILADNWNGNRNDSIVFDVDNFEQVKEAFIKLDQKKHTQLILEGEESYLLIGGGNNFFVVTFTVGEDEEFFNLINPPQKENETEFDLVTGGQMGSFPSRLIVDTNLVIEAMQYYFEKRAKNPKLLWEED